MTVISTEKDTEALSFRLVAEFDAGIERVWRIWADPRQLERWWGPPTWPATFDAYEFALGGRAAYFMRGPDGETSRGWWRITGIDAPHRLTFDDGFADENGDPVPEMGETHATVTLEDLGGRTRMTMATTFESVEQLDQMVAMGMEEGLTLALGQVDALLAEDAQV
ncbi:SRPBCC family protein [Arthrobacter sp. TMS2-4]